jgi:tetratricopeptide (TPR) repeat protein
MKQGIRLSTTAMLLGAMLLLANRANAQGDAAGLYRDSYALEAKKDYAGATGKMKEVTRLNGASYFGTMRMAWLAYLAGDFPGSIGGYTAAIAAEPKVVEPRLGLTLPLLAARNWKDLEHACRDALAIDPHNAIALARLAAAQYWGTNYPGAESTYRQLTVDYPSDLDYKTGLAWALLKEGRTADARLIFTAVLAVSPDNVNAKAGMAAKWPPPPPPGPRPPVSPQR